MRYVQSGYGRKKYQPPQKRWFSGLRKKRKTPKKLYRSNEEVAWRSNPVKKEKAPLTKLHIALFSFPVLVMAWVAVLLYTPFFHITRISYSGLRVTKLSEMQNLIENTVLKGSVYFPANDFFFINTSRIADTIKNTFPVNSVEVVKRFPNVLEIAIDEKISSIIYDNGYQYYLLDQTGSAQRYLKDVAPSENQTTRVAQVTYSDTTSTLLAQLLGNSASTTQATSSFVHTPNYATIRREYGGYPLVYDNTMPSITTTSTAVIPAKKISGIIRMYSLIEKGGVARIRYMEIGDAGAGAQVLSNQPWKIYFEPNDDIETQYTNLKAILKNNKPTQYIDVRYGDRIFWK